MEDFDKYLNGEMSDGERSRFEQALAGDPALQTELRVREGLRQLRLQKKVDEVAAARKDWEWQRNWRRVLLGCAIAGLVGLAVFVWVSTKETPAAPANTQWPIQEAPVVKPSQPAEKEEVAPVLPEKKETKQGRQPIAEAQLLAEQPLLRSAYEDLDAASFQLLDSLLALTRKSPKKDANWKKAMQYFAEGKPAEAKATIFQLEKTDATEAKWLLALAQLAQGKSEEATAAFESIARTVGHPRQAAAKRALSKLRE